MPRYFVKSGTHDNRDSDPVYGSAFDLDLAELLAEVLNIAYSEHPQNLLPNKLKIEQAIVNAAQEGANGDQAWNGPPRSSRGWRTSIGARPRCDDAGQLPRGCRRQRSPASVERAEELIILDADVDQEGQGESEEPREGHGCQAMNPRRYGPAPCPSRR